jgi:hypothetical protein
VLPVRAAIVLLLASWLTACSLSGSDDESRSAGRSASPRSGPAAAPPTGELRVEAVDEIAAPHVVGNRVYGLPGTRGPRRLAGVLNAPFTVNLAPAAVPRPEDGGAIVYHAFRSGRPVLRLYDGERRRDSVLADGAFSIAWRRDGTLAYFKGLRAKVAEVNRYRGHVVVRTQRGDRPARWTARPGRYAVAGWARDDLIVYRRTRLSADVLAFDGPGRPRVLARNSFLVSISPDGRQAFTSRPGPSGATVEVIDVASGTRLAREDDQPTSFVAAGSWSGQRVVGATNLGLAVYRVQLGRIALEQTLEVDLNAFPTGLQEPRLEESGHRIVAVAELAAKPRQAVAEAALVDCDRMTLECRQGPPAPALQPPRVLYNPSRP